MISYLKSLLDNILCWLETAGVFVVNNVVAGLADLVSRVVGLLPAMPTLPDVPSAVSTGFSYVAYFFPVEYTFTVLLSVLALWFAWIVLAIPLRWAKAIRGNQ